MRTFTFIFLFFTLQLSAKELEMTTKITDVTVFQSGAQVKRVGTCFIPAGEHEIIVSDATALLKKESIQVKGEGNFTILSVNPQIIFDDVNNEKEKWDQLSAKQKELMKRMEELSVKIQVLNSEEVTISNLKNTSTQTKGVNVDQISKAQEVVRLKLTAIKTEKLNYSREILELFDEHKTVTQHLVSLKSPKQSVHYQIVIKVSAKADCKGDFSVIYVVPNARWYPTYDLRVKSISDPMVIEYKANVMQQSGEDWSNIKLKLSTGDPSQSSQKPKVEPWWLSLNQNYVQPQQQTNFYKYTDARYTHVKGVIINYETGAAIPWCTVLVNGTNIGTTADADGNFALVLPENGTQLKVYSIGYNSQVVAVNDENLTVKLEKKISPLNKTVKTDYEKQLQSVDAPITSEDYNGELSDLEVEVDADTKDGLITNYAFGDQVEVNSPLTMSNSYSMNATTISGSTAPYTYQWSADKKISSSVTAVKTLNIVSTEFSIEEKYTILSSPKNISVAIQSIKTDAKYQYYCAPRLDKDVFLTAQLVNWEQYNLLEGQANVFFEGTFIGNTLFDTRFLVDTLEISLGRDRGIKVERKKSKEFNKRLVLGSDNIATRQWDIGVRNGKQQSIDIIIEDQFPVSADSKIVVEQEEKSGGKLNETTGIVSWSLKIAPSETKNLQLKYKVKYPKGNFVGLD